jgi:deoxyribonuclease-4
VIAAARAAAWVGAKDVVLHLAFYHGDEPSEVADRVAAALIEARQELGATADTVTLRPEVMGRLSQFGDLDEVLRLCQTIEGCAPCIDVAHLHARTGAYNTVREFEGLFDSIADALGASALDECHIHLSGIEYGPSGETRHVALEASDLDYRSFLAAARCRPIRGTIIIESPAREDDVLLVKAAWDESH